MKTFMLLLILLTSISCAEDEYVSVIAHEMNGETMVEKANVSKRIFIDINISVSLWKSQEANISIADMETYRDRFQPVVKEETFQDTDITYWLKVDLGENFPSGRFVYSYGDADFVEHTFTDLQVLEKFTIYGVKHLKFSYDRTRDSRYYYFKLSPKKHQTPFRFLTVNTQSEFNKGLDALIDGTIFIGIMFGLIIMAGLYNGAIYYYSRDRAFLHYMWMQFFMVGVLVNESGILYFSDFVFARNTSYFGFMALMTLLFSTLFTKRFLDTKFYTPKIDRLLDIVLILIVVDMVITLFDESYLFEYNIIPFITLSYLLAGFVRVRQQFKPALFYLLGWSALIVALFIDAFYHGEELVDPIFVGSVIEAILFSLALSYKVKMLADEKEQQKELMIHQSKLASMGEMIGNIAHQWRQPLTYLSYSFMNLKEAGKQGVLDTEYLNKKVDDATKQLEFMSQTIDDFREFYAPNKEKESFSLVTATQETLELMSNSLKQVDIEVKLEVKGEALIENYKNEYKQVLVNLLSNAKEALMSRVISSPQIVIEIDERKVMVCDNAGGVEPSVMHRIFEPYFTTKQGNSGIGLYMSKMIVERNMGGTLKVFNGEVGAVFVIEFCP